MIDNWPILSIVTFLPLAGVLFLLLIKGDEKALAQNSRFVAMWVSGFTFLVSLPLLIGFDSSVTGYQFEEKAVWLAGTGIGYHMGVDGISMPFVLLSTLLTPLAILASWRAITHRVREYMIAFLVQETMMVGMFVSLDMLMFYLFFEAVLIPMFLIIGIWGGPRRVYAAFKFFLYTLLGSVLMLVCMLAMYIDAGTTDIPALTAHEFAESMQTWLFLGFLASFAVKVPMWPVHTWLPDAHVEAPTAGSMILAGVLLKMGGYGFLRFSLPMFPIASDFFAPFVFVLSAIAIIYTSLVAFAQEDMKKLIAYSSVAHMGFVTMGIFAGTEQSVQGAVFQMLSHGWISGALFLCVGVVYDRMHSREIAAYGGLVNRMPIYAAVFLLFTMANVGLPGTSGFVGEFLTILGAFQVSTWTALFAASGVIFSAVYALSLYRRVSLGRIEHEGLEQISDMNRREIFIIAPLIVATILFGVWPMPILDVTASSVDALVSNYQEALAAHYSGLSGY